MNIRERTKKYLVGRGYVEKEGKLIAPEHSATTEYLIGEREVQMEMLYTLIEKLEEEIKLIKTKLP